MSTISWSSTTGSPEIAISIVYGRCWWFWTCAGRYEEGWHVWIDLLGSKAYSWWSIHRVEEGSEENKVVYTANLRGYTATYQSSRLLGSWPQDTSSDPLGEPCRLPRLKVVQGRGIRTKKWHDRKNRRWWMMFSGGWVKKSDVSVYHTCLSYSSTPYFNLSIGAAVVRRQMPVVRIFKKNALRSKRIDGQTYKWWGNGWLLIHIHPLTYM